MHYQGTIIYNIQQRIQICLDMSKLSTLIMDRFHLFIQFRLICLTKSLNVFSYFSQVKKFNYQRGIRFCTVTYQILITSTQNKLLIQNFCYIFDYFEGLLDCRHNVLFHVFQCGLFIPSKTSDKNKTHLSSILNGN